MVFTLFLKNTLFFISLQSLAFATLLKLFARKKLHPSLFVSAPDSAIQ